MGTIFSDVKKLLAVSEDDNSFDLDIEIAINTSLNALSQIGACDKDAQISANDETEWSTIFTDGPLMNMCKNYVYIKARSLFDPPTSSIVASALNSNLDEISWRIRIALEDQRGKE